MLNLAATVRSGSRTLGAPLRMRARQGALGRPAWPWSPARARGECCIVHNREVATLAWKVMGALNGDRFDLVQDSPRARGGDHGHPRARGEFCIGHSREVAMLAWTRKWALNGYRLDFRVKHGYWCMASTMGNTELPTRARRWPWSPARARGGVLYCPQSRSRHVGLETKVGP